MFDSVLKFSKENCRILQLTDMQVVDSAQQRNPDRLSPRLQEILKIENVDKVVFSDVDWLIEKTNPDIIVITGDVVYGEFDDKGTSLQLIIDKFESYGIPWIPIWGNHDNESEKGVIWQCEQLENAENCLFKRGSTTGTGNYTVGIFDKDDNLKRVLYMLNSHGSWCASEKSLASGVKRDYGFEPDQIAWLNEIGEDIEREYGKIPSFACFHTATVDLIEILEQKGVYDRQTRFKKEDFVPYKWEKDGEFGELNETLQIVNPPVLPLLKKLNVDGVFLGHTHINSFSVLSDGIRWTQGLKTGTYGYHRDYLLGGTVIDFSLEEKEFTVFHLPTSEREN